MAAAYNLPVHLQGLSEDQVLHSRKTYGLNIQFKGEKDTWWKLILKLLIEPMMILLILVSTIYFLTGSYGEGYFMLGAILAVASISFYQDNRSRLALEDIESLTAPDSRVIRNGNVQNIPTAEIVPGDLVLAEEGGFINADGTIVYSHDFSVNESPITGEAYSVYKSIDEENNTVYSGTMISSGMAVYRADKTGLQTRIGQIGTAMSSEKNEASPLQKQVESFVKKLSFAGVVIFFIIFIVSFLKSFNWLQSLMKGLTLAMSVLPEEIPVAFTTFMALGSRKLIREGILVKKTRIVETLGSATVVCTDKTGTITENSMHVAGVYVLDENIFYADPDRYPDTAKQLIETAMWASEPQPFDPMEKSIHRIYGEITQVDQRPLYSMVHEFPLGGIPPMMTHVFQNDSGKKIIAAKGAPEAFIPISGLTKDQRSTLSAMTELLASKGLRLLGVGYANGNIASLPARQQDLTFRLLGLIAFMDPVKQNIGDVINQFYTAGIKVKIITGDNAITTKAIASSIGLREADKLMNGEDLLKLPDNELQHKVAKTNIFTRMFPEAKLKAVHALQRNGEVVAMIGDGVNDGPALKAADIGIAMGIKGTEIAKNAADLVLLQDDLGKLIIAVGNGRRIYANLKKAIQYIISIHIPIILTVSVPLLLGWTYPDIFTPVHVIFLELIMGPTCSIVYESEPLEKNALQQPPRPPSSHFLRWSEMSRSILQGLMISAGVLFMYQFAIKQNAGEELTRTYVFMTIVLANIFLTLVNRSFYFSFIQSLRAKNWLLTTIICITALMLIAMIYVPSVRSFFHMTIPSISATLTCMVVAAVSVFWIEIWKYFNRRKQRFTTSPDLAY